MTDRSCCHSTVSNIIRIETNTFKGEGYNLESVIVQYPT